VKCPLCGKNIKTQTDKQYFWAYEMCEKCFIEKQGGEK